MPQNRVLLERWNFTHTNSDERRSDIGTHLVVPDNLLSGIIVFDILVSGMIRSSSVPAATYVEQEVLIKCRKNHFIFV